MINYNGFLQGRIKNKILDIYVQKKQQTRATTTTQKNQKIPLIK